MAYQKRLLFGGSVLFGLMTLPAIAMTLLCLVGLGHALYGRHPPADDWPWFAIRIVPPVLGMSLLMVWAGIRNCQMAWEWWRGREPLQAFKRVGAALILVSAAVALAAVMVFGHYTGGAFWLLVVIPVVLAILGVAHGVSLIRVSQRHEGC